jgi:ubiquinone biosynthesis O-methyltransferase
MGAQVLGVDAVERSVAVARAHGARDPTVAERAQYRAVVAEQLVSEGARFDGVLSLEVVEHVADVGAFTATLAALVQPRGLLVLSTVNRTLRAYALGVVAAEHVLGMVPPGTHDWARFLTPEELAGAFARVCA